MSKYDVILDTLPAKGDRTEILFRQAGDGFIQVEYGYEQRVELLDSFRILAADAKIKQMNIKGLIETLPSLRANMIHFDPTVIAPRDLIDKIKAVEESINGVDDMVIDSRIITLPIAFEDSETKKAVSLYSKQVRPDAPNCADGYNLEYMAQCNGCTVDDIKHMLLDTYWYNSGCGFWPGGGFFWPMDPRCKMIVPKYNPPRIWTPEGAVGIGGACLFTYTTATGGGYQLFGRTIPTFQLSMKHPQFKEGPFLYRPSGDRIKFVEVSEQEILDIYDHVHDKTDYVYDIQESQLIIADGIIAITGSNMNPTINDEEVPMWTAMAVKISDALKFSHFGETGFRSYICVSGGIDVPEYLGSKSTCLFGSYGGFEGRKLAKDDVIAAARKESSGVVGKKLNPKYIPEYTNLWELRAIPGPNSVPDYVTEKGMDHLFSTPMKISHNANRAAYRLEEVPDYFWAREDGGKGGSHPSNIVDHGYNMRGAINVTSNTPSILIADGPTLGGFVCVGNVINADLWKIGQGIPARDKVVFKLVTVEDAIEARKERSAMFAADDLII